MATRGGEGWTGVVAGRAYRAIELAAYPIGVPRASDFRVIEQFASSPTEGEVLVSVSHLSIDPFERLRMSAEAVGSAVAPGQLVPGRGIGHVIDTAHDGFLPGDLVGGDFGWREIAAVAGEALSKLDEAVTPPERHLSLVGASGLTAYCAVVHAASLRSGETMLVAPGAGSVGSLAAQIGALIGARVVGVGRGARQCDALRALQGFSGAIDCESDAATEFDRECPTGVDVFIDGLGGAFSTAAAPNLNVRARVVLIGCVAQYCARPRQPYGDFAQLLFRRARAEGFLLADWQAHHAEATRQLLDWADQGRVAPVESIWNGLESAPAAFVTLFGVAPPGKQIVRILDDNRRAGS